MMKTSWLAGAVFAGAVLGIPTTALAFNPQPDPPKIAVSVDLSVGTTAVLVTQLQLWPPGPTKNCVMTLLPPDVCQPSPVTG
jgi:hypothetical protein